MSGPDWLALPIGAAASNDTSVDISVGVFSCPVHQSPAAGRAPAGKAQSQVANLEIALSSNRDIGTASAF